VKCDSDEDVDEKIKNLQERLAAVKTSRHFVSQRRQHIAKKSYELSVVREGLEAEVNALRQRRSALADELDSAKDEADRTLAQLQRFMQINVLNDAFYVWYSGPYATINNFRLGNLSTRPIEWVEINAALGQCVLAVATIAARIGLEFKKYYLHPLGSFAKLTKVDDRRTILYLYIDQSFSLFPKTNFNRALGAFLQCLHEFGEHITRHDPTLSLPYSINSEEGKVNDYLVFLGNDEDIWTKGLKFMLSDIKWIIAWAAKHSYDYL
jgi:beclin